MIKNFSERLESIMEDQGIYICEGVIDNINERMAKKFRVAILYARVKMSRKRSVSSSKMLAAALELSIGFREFLKEEYDIQSIDISIGEKELTGLATLTDSNGMTFECGARKRSLDGSDVYLDFRNLIKNTVAS